MLSKTQSTETELVRLYKLTYKVFLTGFLTFHIKSMSPGGLNASTYYFLKYLFELSLSLTFLSKLPLLLSLSLSLLHIPKPITATTI